MIISKCQLTLRPTCRRGSQQSNVTLLFSLTCAILLIKPVAIKIASRHFKIYLFITIHAYLLITYILMLYMLYWYIYTGIYTGMLPTYKTVNIQN